MPDPFALCWEYRFRHAYVLPFGRSGMEEHDEWQLELRRIASDSDHPELDSSVEPPLSWLRVFGLDREGPEGGAPDGIADLHDPAVFDPAWNVLFLPCFTPFDPPPARLEEWTGVEGYDLEAPLRVPQLYREDLNSQELADATRFELLLRLIRRG